MHLIGSLKLNLPFYLLKILQKMVTWVQTHPKHTAHSIYHQGLIKLLLISQLSKEGQSWESFLSELGFEEKVKEKGKKAAEDLNQQTKKHEEHTKHLPEEGKYFIEEPKQMNNLFPETSAIDETTSKQLKEDHKNLDTLSMVIKNINSRKEEQIQVLNQFKAQD